ncbi:conserved exported hypothetical protein [Burkholderiales bacterium 8X]|nr:conserved exported hypothetical protein [Burkholderiales bacterium 8X]
MRRKGWASGLACGVLAMTLHLAQAASAAGAERVALVIGNSAYRTAPLENSTNDARDIAELLRQAGFQVDLRLETTKVQLFEALQGFGETVKDKRTKVGVFYYAGHGAQQAWRNFLVPVDANVQSAEDVALMSVDVSELTTEMARTRDRNFLMILDACRDDPFGLSFKPAAKGLTQYDAPVGSLLAYATGPGRVASDGGGRNGLYTSHLLRELSIKGVRVEDAFKRVRLGVRLASRGKQIPWESTSLEEDLYIYPPARRSALSNGEQEELLDREVDAWRVAKNINSVDSLASFLREYPSGNVSELASARLNALMREQAPRPRLAQLHVPEIAASTSPVPAPAPAPTAALTVAIAAMPNVRAIEDRETAQPAAAPVSLATPTPTPTQTPSAMQLQTSSPTTAAPAAGSLSVSPNQLAPAQAAASQQVAVTPPVVPAAEAPQELSIAATPVFQGSYEFSRRYRVGDVFRYRVINRFNDTTTPLEMRVTAVDSAKDEVVYNGGEFQSDTMGNVTRNQRGALNSPRQFYPAELFVGKKWTTMFRQSREGNTYNTFRYQLKVVGKETVTVPAGRFEAYKIEARGFNLQRRAAIERDIWVAPGVDADIVHETRVRLGGTASGMIEQFDRQELVSLPVR